jgi:hypothetical protein
MSEVDAEVSSTEAEALSSVPLGSGHPRFPTRPDHRAESRAGGALGCTAVLATQTARPTTNRGEHRSGHRPTATLRHG